MIRRAKVIQVNGIRAIIGRVSWDGWTADYTFGGRRFWGSDDTLAGLRRGLHVMTTPETLRRALALRDVSEREFAVALTPTAPASEKE